MKKAFSYDIHEGMPALPDRVRQFRGSHRGDNRRIGIVAARFNIALTGELVRQAVDTLVAQGVKPEDIVLSWVPGSFEIPLALRRLARSSRFDALIAVGVVIEGGTRHAEVIADTLAPALVRLSLDLDCPVIDAVVCARTPEQAEERCRGGASSRGVYAALAALEVCSSYPIDA